MVQLPLTAKLEPQLFVSVKSAAFAPAKLFAFAGILNAAFPLFNSDGAEGRYCPVPDKYNVWGLLFASSFITILAVLVSTSLGVNVT